MENQLQKYMGQNLKNIITDIQVVQGTAKDSGNLYYAIELNFVNGYKKRLFLKSDEQFAWVNAIESLQTINQMDSAL